MPTPTPTLTRELIGARLPPRLPSSVEAETLSEFELRATMLKALADRPTQDGIWVFAYGALLWERKFEWDTEETRTVRGLVRRYCLTDSRNRGTPEHPGITLGLLHRPGGECCAAAIHLPEKHLRDALWTIWRQEMAPGYYDAEWITAGYDGHALPMLAFVAKPGHRLFAGEPSADHTAEMLASTVGEGGTAAEYLLDAVEALRERGCRDDYLEDLAERVAVRLA